MVKDFVRKGVAYLRCLECGEETTILKYELQDFQGGQSGFINDEMTKSNLKAFTTKHLLCKKENIQLEIIEDKQVCN